MKERHFVVALLVALLICFSSSSWAYVITGTGGDCTLFGTWNGKTKVCTLTTDISANTSNINYGNNGYKDFIDIDGSGVTLDGNGHTIDGSAFVLLNDHLAAINVGRQRGNTIKNLRITNFTYGIGLSMYSSNTKITGNTLTGNSSGISVGGGSPNNVITGNTISNTSYSFGIYMAGVNNVVSGNFISGSAQYGIMVDYVGGADANTISNNTVSNNKGGIRIFSQNNIVTGNTFSGNTSVDLQLSYISGNSVYNNNFLSVKNFGWDIDRALNYTPSVNFINEFNKDLPIGGNYWSNFDSPEEGCDDVNLDGICDQPLNLIESSTDNLPWTTQNGWPVTSGGSTGGGTKGGGGRR